MQLNYLNCSYKLNILSRSLQFQVFWLVYLYVKIVMQCLCRNIKYCLVERKGHCAFMTNDQELWGKLCTKICINGEIFSRPSCFEGNTFSLTKSFLYVLHKMCKSLQSSFPWLTFSSIFLLILIFLASWQIANSMVQQVSHVTIFLQR